MTASAEPAPVARVTQISHVALQVADLERSIGFYREVLGLEVFEDDRDNPDGSNIKGAVGGFGIELSQRPAAAAAATQAESPSLSFAVENLDEAFAALRARHAVAADAPMDVDGVRFFTIRDPDGLAIELIQFPAPLRGLADLRHIQR
ncbi:MAG: VOC family protein [Caulobacteraceae bacterium]